MCVWKIHKNHNKSFPINLLSGHIIIMRKLPHNHDAIGIYKVKCSHMVRVAEKSLREGEKPAKGITEKIYLFVYFSKDILLCSLKILR